MINKLKHLNKNDTLKARIMSANILREARRIMLLDYKKTFSESFVGFNVHQLTIKFGHMPFDLDYQIEFANSKSKTYDESAFDMFYECVKKAMFNLEIEYSLKTSPSSITIYTSLGYSIDYVMIIADGAKKSFISTIDSKRSLIELDDLYEIEKRWKEGSEYFKVEKTKEIYFKLRQERNNAPISDNKEHPDYEVAPLLFYRAFREGFKE